jgi:hypothetical protein
MTIEERGLRTPSEDEPSGSVGGACPSPARHIALNG